MISDRESQPSSVQGQPGVAFQHLAASSGIVGFACMRFVMSFSSDDYGVIL